jgi:hypothetical protein
MDQGSKTRGGQLIFRWSSPAGPGYSNRMNAFLPSPWWFRRMPWAAACLLLGILVSSSRAQEAGDWHFDVLQLKNGKKIQGLILEETPTEIHFVCMLMNALEISVFFLSSVVWY